MHAGSIPASLALGDRQAGGLGVESRSTEGIFMTSADLMNELAHAVGLDQHPGFERAIPGTLFEDLVRSWIALAEQQKVKVS